MAVPVSHHLGGAQLRSLEKVLDDAHMTGILNLSGRNMRDFPKSADNFDLMDTVDVDISKNRFMEVPYELCEYVSLERLNCYNNAIRTVPDAFARLTMLTYLNLSRNSLSALPIEICEIYLEVLIVSNNKLVALPPAVGKMKTLMHLDASCNELDTLPIQIGEMESLKELNLRRNHLMQLPEEISRLPLVMLDVSCNKITFIPPSYRHIKTLDILKLEHNPLEMPPAQVCTRGKVHIFKYLNNVATKDERRSRLEQNERLSRRSYNNAKYTWLATHEAATRFGSAHNNNLDTNQAGNQSVILSPSTLTAQYVKGSEGTNGSPRSSALTPQSSIDSDSSHSTLCNGDLSVAEELAFWNAKIGELRRGTLTADSGYIDGDKRWSATEPSNDDEEARILADRANQQKELRQQRGELLNQSLSSGNSSFGADNEADIDYIDTGEDGMEDGEITPTQTEPDEFTKALTRQKAIYEDQKLKAREELVRQEEAERQWQQEEERWKTERRREAEQERYRRSSPSGSLLSVNANGNVVNRGGERSQKPRPLSSSSFSECLQRPTTLEINRQKRQQRRATVNVADNIRSSSVDRNSYNRMSSGHSSNLPNGRLPSATSDSHRQLKRADKMTTSSSSSLAPSRDSGISQSRHEAQLARRRQEEEKARNKQIQKEAVRNFVQSRNSTSSLGSPGHEEQDLVRERSPASAKSPPPPPPTTYSGSAFGSIKPRSAFNIGSGKPQGDVQPNFTVKREMNKYREEMDRIEQLRKCIEARLKVTLPDDIPGALEDGVVLCHFMNNVFPHAVPTIHVPSPAVPKLSSAKCRRNVENFLKACSNAGVPGEKLCTSADILEGKGLVKVAATVQSLLANTPSHHKLSSAV
ncbi:leucine-rich repeat and calponin homology domain-containing protein 3-like isoform X3 [Acanthaster planci]|uniref:Leucine-rich repeat and calponin homology domain-containing protein 3-like isoform X3 n=1 Tax=Acanthaster planci TaxID=133434 RepID=A0A8B7Y6K9_ACAPL|nr:leucine-rich repeat and calponin homology domain-containing protein 3-like isoform X3 [Acanthaster planci]